MKFNRILLAAGALPVIANPSAAHAWQFVGEDDTCAFIEIFEGPGNTAFSVHESKEMFDNGQIFVIIKNDQWSLKQGDTVGQIKLIDTDGDWLSNTGIAMENGFALRTDYKALQRIFGSYATGLTVQRDGKDIDSLSLTGAYDVWVKFDRCRRPWEKAKEKAEHERKIEEKWTGDPFADN